VIAAAVARKYGCYGDFVASTPVQRRETEDQRGSGRRTRSTEVWRTFFFHLAPPV
jgi:hypothetical protein